MSLAEGLVQKKQPLPQALEALPDAPGVYLFLNESSEVLYVGKAKILRQRVLSYFRTSSRHGPRIEKMVHEARFLDFIVAQSEIEALILENSLIKSSHPKYNILLRDDKTYPYIVITQEPFPRVKITRRRQGRGSFFGPFASARSARAAVEVVHRYLKVRNCDFNLESFRGRACLQFHLGRCDAPCEKKVTSETYALGIHQTRLFLSGKTKVLLAQLEKDMQQASERLAFERAAELRDTIIQLTKLQIQQRVETPILQAMDVLAWEPDEGGRSVLVILSLRNGKMAKPALFEQITNPLHDQEEWLSQVTQYYLELVDPPTLLIVEHPSWFALLPEVMKEKRGITLNVQSPDRPYKESLLQMAKQNARIHLDQSLSHPALEALADLLDLAQLPRLIEGFDISNTQGNQSFGAMVSFREAQPHKAGYRLFHIKSVSGPNDFASLEEVVFRRYQRLLREQKPLPDLILIDGGKGQLASACNALEQLGMGHQAIVSLAKKEELLFLPDQKAPIRVPHHHAGLQLLRFVRDEAHRFGITAHRKRRGKTAKTTLLETMPGIGPARTKTLLLHFGSLKAIQDATIEELGYVLGAATAARLHPLLRQLVPQGDDS
jgi:excinuclease ABC subunit C